MNTLAWYYARRGATERCGPVPTRVLRALLTDGRLSPDDLVWRDGLREWIRAGDVPEFQSDGSASPALSPALRRWMTLAGVLSIFSGIGGCLTLFGAATGVLMIIAGSAMLGARTALGSISSADPAWAPFMDQLARYARAMTWALFLGILGTVFFVCFYFGLFAGILSGIP
ncbi:MAG TPA: DUF5362 family protein [Kiritimatiellia bacterium]|nr:DUF5362 family protein [Kiritimatiellia bacterium]HRZ13230.1 DUF5362 family protein [Kiritimatiellia bacterium]HSA18679.1 DUF5362 family protein [Kiritimatiellia bacterium]